MKPIISTKEHYDILIEQNNDPVNDPIELKSYMDKWDGEPFIEFIKPTSEKSILEIGVGTGRIAQKVLSLGCRQFTGIDISEKTINRASQHLCSYSNVKLINGDFISLELKEKYDIIYSTLTFFHIKDKKKAIEKVYNLLNTGGKFVLSFEKNTEEIFDLGEYEIKMYPDCIESILPILELNGFQVIDKKDTEKAVLILSLA